MNFEHLGLVFRDLEQRRERINGLSWDLQSYDLSGFEHIRDQFMEFDDYLGGDNLNERGHRDDRLESDLHGLCLL